MTSTSVGKTIAQYLHETQSARISPEAPFRWASGWQSPVYCDNRRLLSFPLVREAVADALTAAVRERFPTAEAVAAVATAGIPMGALIADRLGLPFAYVRAKPKEHGMGNRIEGLVRPERQVVVVEDLISTGGSSLDAVEALREAGAAVAGLVSVFTYGFPATERRMADAGVRCHSLANLDDLLSVLQEKDGWDDGLRALIGRWREKPESWKPEGA